MLPFRLGLNSAGLKDYFHSRIFDVALRWYYYSLRVTLGVKPSVNPTVESDAHVRVGDYFQSGTS